ncbi:endonuclease/exonuclease/phosphatase family protein [Oceanobacillus luteolus]|uniref:Endonuclease/exonuclease/phosphatase family protein n=1 Tax=Oceanobacillus luteolus TaxID=1274358 RepID=A0ABW4HWR0_9BACI|nr:endonuclease/exonuclease/phosphatase family protein [Oceanobacillus luteolus]MCM3741262.1 endonuclease/exonuclease/phosphatase family protein [Oceanobacillus luteolus]
MRKKLLFIVLISSLFILGMSGSVFAKGKDKSVPVKVMSYNIHHGVGLDEELDLQRISNVIENTGAEIIGIQEVDRFFGERSNFEDQARKLASLLDYHYVYGANLDLLPEEEYGNNRQYGTAILSKYPIIASENIHLVSFGNEQRGLLRAKINIKGVHINFYNTHLGLTTEERIVQVEEIAEVTSSFNEPSVLVGDLNAEPDSKEFRTLLERAVLNDTFANVEDGNTFPVRESTKRIDYILTSPTIKYFKQEVVYSEASDHLPIVVDLLIRR